MSSSKGLIFILAILILHSARQQVRAQTYSHTDRFTHEIYPLLDADRSHYLGQEVRLRLIAAANSADIPTINATAGATRVRIIAAYPGRGTNGTLEECGTAEANGVIWAETASLGKPDDTISGRHHVAEAYFTFVVPPFPWRICVRSSVSPTWRGVEYPDATPEIRSFNETALYYTIAGSSFHEGDFVAMRIFRPQFHFEFSQTVPANAEQNAGDNVKLVPAGFPCTYENVYSIEGQTDEDYCGSNMLDSGNSGTWITDRCSKEGSPTDGVGKIGTNKLNPFIDTIAATRALDDSTESLIAFFRLPVADRYDVCYSPFSYRNEIQSKGYPIAAPLWFKLMKLNSSCYTGSAIPPVYESNCTSRDARLVVSAFGAAGALTWAVDDELTELSWAAVRVEGTGLSTYPATAFDKKCASCDKEYYTTEGGDILRIVPESKFVTTNGTEGYLDLYTYHQRKRYEAIDTSADFGAEKLVIEYASIPPIGTSASVGCWWNDEDNDGTCGACNTGLDGPTMSWDLGANPHRSQFARLWDDESVTETFAYVRLPSEGSYYICYRQNGGTPWRILRRKYATEAPCNFSTIPPTSNFTYTLDDVHGSTLAPFVVQHPQPVLTTLRSNYTATGAHQNNTFGGTLRLVPDTEGCDTVSPVALSYDAGLRECTPEECGASCSGCTGSADETDTGRTSVYFYVSLPAYVSDTTKYRVCFRNKGGSWRQIRNGTGDDEYLYLRPDPTYSVSFNDVRALTWAPFTFTATGVNINVAPYNGTAGSMFRVVLNSSNCDITWGASSNPQEYSSTTVNADLGVRCTAVEPSGICSDSALNYTWQGLDATTPYSMINTDADSEVEQALGFITLPVRTPPIVGHKICFKTGSQNWFVAGHFSLKAQPRYALYSVESQYVAGSYNSLTVRSTGADFIDISRALLKLVKSPKKCHEAADGTRALDGQYTSFTLDTNRGSRWTNSTRHAITSGILAEAQAWFTFPNNFSGSSQQYTVCFGDTESNVNWLEIGTINVVSREISFYVTEELYNGASQYVYFLATGAVVLDPGVGKDSAKIVPTSSPCAEGDLPSDVTSDHVGLEFEVNDTEVIRENGVTDLGPDDTASTNVTKMRVTFPNPVSTVGYRVCYKPFGGVWQEVDQATDASLRPFDLGENGLYTLYAGVEKVQISGLPIIAQQPLADVTYYGLEFTKLGLAGAATLFDTASTAGGASSITHGFSVIGTGLTDSDTLRILRITAEVVPGEYSAPAVGNCESADYELEVTRTAAASTATSSVFDFMLPVTPGRILFCYKRSNMDHWFHLNSPEGLNPLTLTATGLLSQVGDTEVTLVDDAFAAQRLLSSLTTTDRFYFASFTSTALCGVAPTADGNAALSTAAASLTGTGATPGEYYTTLKATATSWYPISTAGRYIACFYKSLMAATVAGGSYLPFVKSGGWYRIPVVDGVMTPFYTVGAPALTLQATCPVITDIVAGTSFEVTVEVKDSGGNVVPSPNLLPVEITAVAQNAWELVSESTNCRISDADEFDVSSATTSTTTGVAVFSIKSLSACPSGGNCEYKFTSSSGLTSNVCTLTVVTATVTAISASGTLNCPLGTVCTVAFTAQDANGNTAYTSNDAVSLTVSQHSGLQYVINGAAATPGGTTSRNFVNGVLTLEVVPSFSTIADWPEATTWYTAEFFIDLSGGINATHITNVLRPVLYRATIFDLVLCNWDGSEANDVNSNQYPRWEPSATYPLSYWNPNASNNVLSSVPAYPIIAGQYYKVTLVAKDSFGNEIESPDIFTASPVAISMVLTNADDANEIIGQPPSADVSHSYADPFVPVFFDSVRKGIVFRMKNAAGCGADSGGCRINFLFNGVSLPAPSYIETTVYSPAIALRARCKLPGEVNLTDDCPVSAVEKGLYVQVEALDAFGGIATHYTGTIFLTVRETDTGVERNATFVSRLGQSGDISFSSQSATAGILVLPDLTFEKPCTSCTLEFFTDWNAGRAKTVVSLPASTKKINCFLSSSQTYFVVADNGQAVSTQYTPSMASRTSKLLIYPDTDLCFDVEAVNEAGQRTMYESSWVHYTVRPTGASAVTVTPSPIAPLRYRFLEKSQARFCMTAQGADGATFAVDFIVQQLSIKDHWTLTGGTCTLSPFTLREKRFIGKLVIGSTTGLTMLSNWQPPKSTVWGYKRLAASSDTVTISASFYLYDHYGKRFSGDSQLAPQHASLSIGIGRCGPSQLSSGTCEAGYGQTTGYSINVRSHFPYAQSGALRAALTSSTWSVTRSSNIFQLSLSGWTLKSDIAFYLFNGTSKYTGPIFGEMASIFRVSILLPTSTPTYIAFPRGKSPWKTSFDANGNPQTYWMVHRYTNGSTTDTPTGPVLFHSGCFAAVSCAPKETQFMTASALDASPTVLAAPGGNPLQLFVIRALAAPSEGEPYCTSDCYSQGNWAFSQADIFNNYTMSISVGTQKLSCSAGTCSGSGTTTVSVECRSPGSTIESALEGLGASLPTTSFKLTGLENSNWYSAVSLNTGVEALPSAAGAFTASVAGGTVTPLSSAFGSGSDSGTYVLVWRSAQTASKVTFRNTAMDAPSDDGTKYPKFDPPSGTSYSGYLTSALPGALLFDYTKTTIAANVPFPMTFQVHDESEFRTAAEGTVTAKVADWLGCNNGGTLTLVRGGTFTGGRGTIWIKFSAPCQRCVIRLTVTPTSANALTVSSAISVSYSRLRATSQSILVKDYLPGSATAVYATTATNANEGSITVDTLLSIAVASYSSMGNLAVEDVNAPIEISVYNKISTAGGLTYGNGGLLRSSTAVVNNVGRHAIRAWGTGSASLTFAFQRTCSLCNVLLVWRLPTTSTSGSFVLRNNIGTAFIVSAPTLTAITFGPMDRVILKGTTTSIAIWSAYSSANIPFAGYAASAPDVVVPTLSVDDATGGDGGRLYYNTTVTAKSVVYHVLLTSPCNLCTLTFGPLSIQVVVRTVATHYRVESLLPRTVAPSSTLTLKIYASDDEGDMDVLIGSTISCDYFRPFFCNRSVRALTISASMTGKEADGFAPAYHFMHLGGPSVDTFVMAPSADLYIEDGQTPPGGAQFTLGTVPVVHSKIFVSDSYGLTSAAYPTFDFSVDIGLTGVHLATDSPGADAIIFETFEVKVGFVKQIDPTSNYYVALGADNTIVVRFSGECNLWMLSSYYVRMVKGIATFRMKFFKVSVGQPCYMKFTSIAGSATCSASGCSTTAEVKAYGLQATSWDFKIPTSEENGGKDSGPMYAVAGRTQSLQAMLLEDWGYQRLLALLCGRGTCQFVVRARESCNPQPAITPSGGSGFDVNGTARVNVTWKYALGDEARTFSYSCGLLISVLGALIDGPVTTEFAVDVTIPKRIVLINETSNPDMLLGVVRTGVSYPFQIMSLNANGDLVHGDTGYGIATRVFVSLVTADGQPASNISVINLNMTGQSTAHGEHYTTSAYLYGGSFIFNLVFTESTRATGMGPVRVKFEAYSAEPPISMSVYSRAFETEYSPMALRVVPPLPRYVSRYSSYKFDVYAVDAVPAQWFVGNGLPQRNVSSSAEVEVLCHPSFRRILPLQFDAGSQVSTLHYGKSSFEVTFTGDDADYQLQFVDPSGILLPTELVTVTLQSPAFLAIETVMFRTGAPATCVSDCTMKSPTFSHQVGTTLEYVNSTRGELFNLSVVVIDAAGYIMHADTEGIVIGCKMESNVASDKKESEIPNIAKAPTLITKGPLFVSVGSDARANFTMGLVGNTWKDRATKAHEYATIECYCASDNCSYSSAKTLPIAIDDCANVTAEMTAQLSDAPVLKIPTTLDSISDLDIPKFRSRILGILREENMDFVSEENAQETIVVTVCTVVRDFFGFADLRNSVCLEPPTGSEAHSVILCTNGTCPPFVLNCTCNTGYTQEHLQEEFYNMSFDVLGVDVQIEVTLTLDRAPRFKGCTLEEIEAMQLRMQNAVLNALTSDREEFQEFEIVSDTVLTTSRDARSETAAPLQTLPPLGTFSTLPPPNETKIGGMKPVGSPVVLLVALLWALLFT